MTGAFLIVEYLEFHLQVLLRHSDHKKVKYFIVSSDKTLQFEFVQNCIYIKNSDKKQDCYSIGDFELLKNKKLIPEMCDHGRDAGGINDIWASAYSELFREIETKINKRVFLCDLTDGLIEFRRHIRVD